MPEIPKIILINYFLDEEEEGSTKERSTSTGALAKKPSKCPRPSIYQAVSGMRPRRGGLRVSDCLQH